jgi:hypothetical protein
MSRVIWKEIFSDFHPGPGSQMLCELSLPAEAGILHVDYMNEQFCVWFSVDEKHATETERFTFAFVPTGGDIPEMNPNDQPRHLGTLMQEREGFGILVWHVFLISTN